MEKSNKTKYFFLLSVTPTPTQKQKKQKQRRQKKEKEKKPWRSLSSSLNTPLEEMTLSML